MKLKYENYMLDKTVPEYLVATLISLVFHSADREQFDFYATEPKAVELLLEEEQFQQNILEPCCGLNHITDVLRNKGYQVTTSDLIDRGIRAEVKDFFEYEYWGGDIVTNPPYSQAVEFVEHSLKITEVGSKIAMFLKIQFLEGKKRKSSLNNTHLSTFM